MNEVKGWAIYLEGDGKRRWYKKSGRYKHTSSWCIQLVGDYYKSKAKVYKTKRGAEMAAQRLNRKNKDFCHTDGTPYHFEVEALRSERRMKMDKVILLESVKRRLERVGITVQPGVEDTDGKVRYALAFTSPNGVSENILTDYFTKSNVPAKNTQFFITALQTVAHEYDVCYQTYLCLDDTGHGKKGYPYDMKDCYEDRKAVKDILLDSVEGAKIAMQHPEWRFSVPDL